MRGWSDTRPGGYTVDGRPKLVWIVTSFRSRGEHDRTERTEYHICHTRKDARFMLRSAKVCGWLPARMYRATLLHQIMPDRGAGR